MNPPSVPACSARATPIARCAICKEEGNGRTCGVTETYVRLPARFDTKFDEDRALPGESFYGGLTAGRDPSALNVGKERPVSSIENAKTLLTIGRSAKMTGRIVSSLSQSEIEQLNENLSEIAAHPLVEDLHQERSPLFRAEGLMSGDFVDSGDELDEPRPNLIAEKVIEVQRAADIVRVDRGEHAELDAVRFHQSRGPDDGVCFVAAPCERDVRTISYVMSGFSGASTDPARLNRTHDRLAAEEHWLCHEIRAPN
jgi:hypothetical protein